MFDTDNLFLRMIIILFQLISFNTFADDLCVSAISETSFSSGYSWDTWVARDHKTKTYHSYSQWVPANDFSPDSFLFHNKAKIFHRVSKDGDSWTDKGIIQFTRTPSVSSNLAFWSGHTVIQNGLFYMYYTRATNLNGARQEIHLAVSTDGQNYQFKKRLFLPEDIKKSNHYVFSSRKTKNGSLIPALRDPHIYQVSSRRWIMLLAANTKNKNGTVTSAIAVAESRDLVTWQLRSPLALDIPPSTEVELPNIKKIKGPNGSNFLLMASVRKVGKVGVQFWSAKDILGPWQEVNVNGLKMFEDSYGYHLITKDNGEMALSHFNDKTVRLDPNWLKLRWHDNNRDLLIEEN